MNIPTIRPTSAPLSTELGDKAARWAVVYTKSGRGYLGRMTDADNHGTIKLADPFDYVSGRVVMKDAHGAPKGIRMHREIYPCEHSDVDEILVEADVVIPLAKMAPKLVESIREALIPAWEGRDHIRKVGGRLSVVERATT